MTKTYGVKTLAVVIVMTMALTILSACGGGGKDDQMVGRWNATTIEMEGITMDVESAFAMMGMEADMYFEFDADGNVILSMMGMSMEGTYKVSGSKVNITIDNETEALEIKGNTIIMEDDDIGKVIFEKA